MNVLQNQMISIQGLNSGFVCFKHLERLLGEIISGICISNTYVPSPMSMLLKIMSVNE